MPLYEYECAACTGRFEVLVRTPTSDSQPSCPDCGAAQARKIFSLVARPVRAGGGGEMAPSSPQPSFGGGCCGGACGCGH